MPSTAIRVAAAGALAILVLGACSSSSASSAHPSSTTSAAGASGAGGTVTPAPGPAATVSGPLTGGQGINLASGDPADAGAGPGWVEDEYSVSGTATAYSSAGPLPTDGRFALSPSTTAPYRTRIVVRRPARARDFSGTVIVEWLNVSGGLDASPDYGSMRPEIRRRGDAWVGVSAQRIGIEGGPVAVRVPAAEAAGAGKGIRAIDPARYGSLHHPGDAYSYDIFTQVSRALRGAGGRAALGGLRPARVLAVGESQSAFALTTYVDGVQPLTREFDGFLIHSRGGAAAPLGTPGAGIDIAGSVGGAPTRLRTDGPAPVMVVQTETDILGVLMAYPARQDDSARLRWWEVAGTAHADRALVGVGAAGMGCAAPINDGPMRFVVRTALADLDTWVRGGSAPPHAPRLAVDATRHYVRDRYGNVTGGIRTPLVDVPVDTLSGESAGGSVVCILSGSTTPLSDAQLHERYRSRAQYVQEFRAATDRAIHAGFLLPADRAEVLATAAPARVPN
jgi:hypothetical protein